MAKKMYVGVSGVARNVKQPYIGVNAVARKVKTGYIGVGGVARQFFASEPVAISKLSVGSSIYMNVEGARKEFIIVHQGYPSPLYDSSCNGTWLLLKGVYDNYQVWDLTDNDYKNSDIHTYLNDTFFGFFDSGIRSIIKQVKIPYHNGTGSDGSVASSSSGLSTKIFLLSGYEVGWTTSNQRHSIPVDGVCLKYFSGTAETDSKRVAYDSTTMARVWWLRSTTTTNTNYVLSVSYNGAPQSVSVRSGLWLRPALILPSTTLVDDLFNIII